MSNVRSKAKVVALACADVHLCSKAPISRSEEADWYQAMAKPLTELISLATEYDVPVLCAGDIFDRWNPNPELLNFALEHFGKIDQLYTIPGQHDLPYHGYSDMDKSGYGVLRKVGVISDIVPGTPEEICSHGVDLLVHGFPWNHPVTSVDTKPDVLQIALVHEYCWKRGHSYPGADKRHRASEHVKKLQGYDVAIYGDNHKGFTHQQGDVTVYNCGGFMRRKSDELMSRPAVGLVLSDGTVTRHYLDLEGEKLLMGTPDLLEVSDKKVDAILQFVEGLRESAVDALDFWETVNRYAASMDDERVSIVLKSILEEIG